MSPTLYATTILDRYYRKHFDIMPDLLLLFLYIHYSSSSSKDQNTMQTRKLYVAQQIAMWNAIGGRVLWR
uniref:Uncharacterized protein n=1 Tax=Trichogramma kaykai TaxID=54128 RepID=A0ABD2XLB0_9HYME